MLFLDLVLEYRQAQKRTKKSQGKKMLPRAFLRTFAFFPGHRSKPLRFDFEKIIKPSSSQFHLIYWVLPAQVHERPLQILKGCARREDGKAGVRRNARGSIFPS